MIYIGALRVNAARAAKAAEILSSPEGIEGVVSFLRQAGEDKIGTIKILVKISSLTLGEAKRVVDLSASWTDRREMDEALRTSLESTLGEVRHLAKLGTRRSA